MSERSGKIKFNVTNRGRKHTGQERFFDTALLANMINSPVMQERVKNGDVLGYLGHWPRLKFGMATCEGGIVDGKAVAIEPAVRTTYIHADPNGEIEHEVEFLDTVTGKMACRLHKSKLGGFSSAITATRAGTKQIPTGFHGFDYVYMPNYTKNRGYDMLDGVILDGVMMDDINILDELLGEQNFMMESMTAIFDSLQSSFDLQQEAFNNLLIEREELYSMLLKRDGKEPVINLDGAMHVMMIDEKQESKFDSADEFLTTKLTPFEKDKVEPPLPAEDVLANKFGYR